MGTVTVAKYMMVAIVAQAADRNIGLAPRRPYFVPVRVLLASGNDI